MTKEQLQWAMYEAYVAQLLNRIEAQEAEIARLGTMAEQTRADAVTRAAADGKRIDGLLTQVQALSVALRTEQEAHDGLKQALGIQAAKEAGKVLGMANGEGLRSAAKRVIKERDDMRAALAKEQELHAATALRMATEAAKLVERKHPVKAGEWVTDGHKARQVCKVFADWYLLRTGHTWNFDHCTPCDPPEADHDTPEGKAAAESVIRDDRKTEIKPGDTVRLVRVPTDDEYQDWDAAFGVAGSLGLVTSVVPTCVNVKYYGNTWEWPLSCIEVVRSEPADGIQVGDVAEVFQATGDITPLSDIGLRGTVSEIDLEDKSVRINSLAQNKDEWVDMCDVRKVTP